MNTYRWRLIASNVASDLPAPSNLFCQQHCQQLNVLPVMLPATMPATRQLLLAMLPAIKKGLPATLPAINKQLPAHCQQHNRCAWSKTKVNTYCWRLIASNIASNPTVIASDFASDKSAIASNVASDCQRCCQQ